MIRADSLTYAYTITAAMVAIYMSTFELGLLILFPVILLTTGIVLQIYFNKKVQVDVDTDINDMKEIMFYSIICLAAITATSFFVSVLPQMVPKMQLTGFDTVLFGILMAVAEEQFFRGALLSFMLNFTIVPIAILGNAAVFMVYHLAVYGTNIATMAYVFAGGAIFAFVAYRTRRLSPCMTAHIINNILAVIV